MSADWPDRSGVFRDTMMAPYDITRTSTPFWLRSVTIEIARPSGVRPNGSCAMCVVEWDIGVESAERPEQAAVKTSAAHATVHRVRIRGNSIIIAPARHGASRRQSHDHHRRGA